MGMLSRPKWIRNKVLWSGNVNEMNEILRERKLKTVCVEAACPNRYECWSKRHVTFIILGNVCTRGCLFCNIMDGEAKSPDVSEPQKIAEAVKEIGAGYVVITSVTRDDLKDGGADHFVKTVSAIKTISVDTTIELLIPDLNADRDDLEKIVFSGASIIGHNIETPECLYKDIRPHSDYKKSLNVLRILKEIKQKKGADVFVKSSMMLGLGEENNDIIEALEDLKSAGADIVYLGQYLAPTDKQWTVKKYYTPEEFEGFKQKADEIGFKKVVAAPMVRSSYRS